MSNEGSDVTPDDLITFCKTISNYSYWHSRRQFQCGSSREVSLYDILSYRFELNSKLLDIDSMRYNTTHCALDRSRLVPEGYTGNVVRIYTDNVHAGYVRLIQEKDNTELLLSDLYALRVDDTIHGPAILSSSKREFELNRFSLSNRLYDAEQKAAKPEISLDMVHAIHSPYWPAEATEWITRKRSHGFPSKSIIKQVVSYGCDFVQVSHKRSDNDIEWRFSFSRAELIIARSWTISQRIVYNLLWMLNKKIEGRYLCSYYYKTLMFWACERKPTRFWSRECLAQSACELLAEMFTCVKSKVCVNYFIPGNNMMDHLTDTDLSFEIDALSRIPFQHKIIDFCWNRESLEPPTYRVVSQPWLIRGTVIHLSTTNNFDDCTDSLCPELATDLQYALYVELSDIYRGLYFQQKSLSCVNVSEKYICSLKSESHLLLAVNLCESHEIITHDCNSPFFRVILQFNDLIFYKSELPSNSNIDSSIDTLLAKRPCTAADANQKHQSNYYNELKCILYDRSMKMHDNFGIHQNPSQRFRNGRNLNLIAQKMRNINKSSKSSTGRVEFYREWPGQSPTINASWAIAKAYLANFYYTTQRDDILAIQACHDIVDASWQSNMNREFVERTFPVALSTRFSNIYDKEIQELLGFYSLCSYMFDPGSRSVFLGLCPVVFAHYIKLRVNIRRGAFNDCIVLQDAVDFAQHENVCFNYKKLNSGAVIIKIIFRRYLIKGSSVLLQIVRNCGVLPITKNE